MTRNSCCHFRGTKANQWDHESAPQTARRKLAALARDHLQDTSLGREAYLQLVYGPVLSCPRGDRIPVDSLLNHPAIRHDAAALERLALSYPLSSYAGPCEEYGLKATEYLSALPDAPDSTLLFLARSVSLGRPRFAPLLNRPVVRRSALVWATRAAKLPVTDTASVREAVSRLLAIRDLPLDTISELLPEIAWRLAGDTTGLLRQFLQHRSIKRYPPALMAVARAGLSIVSPAPNPPPAGALQVEAIRQVADLIDDPTVSGSTWRYAIRVAVSAEAQFPLMTSLLQRKRALAQPHAFGEILAALQVLQVMRPQGTTRSPTNEQIAPALELTVSEWEIAVQDPSASPTFLFETVQAYSRLNAAAKLKATHVIENVLNRSDIKSDPAALAAICRVGNVSVRTLLGSQLAKSLQ